MNRTCSCWPNLQKLVFLQEAEEISAVLRPHWLEAAGGRAGVVHSHAGMLEIVPPGTSKGRGVQILLDHLNISANEVTATLLFFVFSSPLSASALITV